MFAINQTSVKRKISKATLVYIMVEDINATVEAITTNGGEIVQPVGADAPEITARFTDPAGNIFGLYQERSLADK